MKHVGQTIKEILTLRKKSQKDLADYLECTPSYISQLIDQGDCPCSRLEKICGYLEVSPDIFFNDAPIERSMAGDITSTAIFAPATVNIGNIGSEGLAALLEEKERIIGLLERQIEVLNNAIGAMSSK